MQLSKLFNLAVNAWDFLIVDYKYSNEELTRIMESLVKRGYSDVEIYQHFIDLFRDAKKKHIKKIRNPFRVLTHYTIDEIKAWIHEKDQKYTKYRYKRTGKEKVKETAYGKSRI